ncbi:flavoprotein [Actinomadura harenae]|uniref:Flavoprotein n=1 Tax=Actinomadura harenae TaxID=2483351 RepID=A0A3M2MCX8_9ACTN|nr:flavoprotein [Actinomadura harenae]RMI47361.1 flavoprotein [Actinomadura harenae]
MSDGPVLYLIACGGRPAKDLPALIPRLQKDGWTVCVIATPSGTKFIPGDALRDLTGHPVRSEYKRPEDPDVLPPPDALAVVPATFNTINKWAQGASDTLALGLLNEAIGLGLPIVAVPWPNAALARHPAFVRSVADLRSWGVNVILDPERLSAPDRTKEPEGDFPWNDLTEALANLLQHLTAHQPTHKASNHGA